MSQPPSDKPQPSPPSNESTPTTSVCGTTAGDQAPNSTLTVIDVQRSTDRITAKVLKVEHMLEELAKSLPKSPQAETAMFKLFVIGMGFENLKTTFNDALNALKIDKSGEVSMFQTDAIKVMADFEKELEVVQKKLEDLQRGQAGS